MTRVCVCAASARRDDVIDRADARRALFFGGSGGTDESNIVVGVPLSTAKIDLRTLLYC